MVKIAIWLLTTVLCGVFYRLGGVGKPFNTRYRDIGCSLITLILWWVLVGFQISLWWVYLIVFGLIWGALSTYWDWLFGYDNFWFSGFMIGLAMFPLMWGDVSWYAILIRSIVLSISIGLWSKFIDKDWLEEFGRGALITLTLPLLFIGV